MTEEENKSENTPKLLHSGRRSLEKLTPRISLICPVKNLLIILFNCRPNKEKEPMSNTGETTRISTPSEPQRDPHKSCPKFHTKEAEAANQQFEEIKETLIGPTKTCAAEGKIWKLPQEEPKTKFSTP